MWVVNLPDRDDRPDLAVSAAGEALRIQRMAA
jgi:hypothetical protein